MSWKKADESRVELGKRYRDKISGYEGVATSRTEFIYGCFRVCLSGFASGEPKDFIFDEPSLELVDPAQVIEQPKVKTGGVRPAVPRTGH